MDIYSLANIIIPCITLGVSLFTPGVFVSCDRLFKGMLALAAVTELLGWLYSDSNAFLYNLYMLLLFHGYFYLYFLCYHKGSNQVNIDLYGNMVNMEKIYKY